MQGDFYPRSPCGERRTIVRLPSAPLNFYPRSPCGERHIRMILQKNDCIFLSTLSLRRATGLRRCAGFRQCDFYPRSPCGERQITPAAPRERADFYPRSPCGERRRIPALMYSLYKISIHALLAESDLFLWTSYYYNQQFLSTLSLRRATHSGFASAGAPLFLSTLSLRRATTCNNNRPFAGLISIHALLAESDLYGNQWRFECD